MKNIDNLEIETKFLPQEKVEYLLKYIIKNYGEDFYKLDYSKIKGLGNFDFEGHIKKFKTLGCKRYIYTDEKNKFHQVIAGLPKSTLENYKKEHPNTDLFNHFSNYMNFETTDKLISK